ncbi:hypothetical protein GCM10009850_015980 [Nonomuraea monospora]|uniref:Glycosyltransferase n=1 Tax=Nonomuraea monospora TaxID=568818 RepID=A0ABN3C9V2_9ACTN
MEHHRGSHRQLIDTSPATAPPARGHVDAIIVPTVRTPGCLSHAMRLAGRLRCPLVSLHSRWWSRADLAADLMPEGTPYLAIDLGEQRLLNLPDLRTTALLRSTRFERTTDIGAKRNLGLLLATLLGWERVVFLDDDVEVDAPGDLVRAAALLDRYDAVGLRLGGFPDNSVVCHAHRLTGGHQESFVGGGALAVETFRNPSFFPGVYNEDWFYLLEERSLRSLAVTGTARQHPYDPFDRPARARDQELGDVLAEGVYWLLDDHGGADWTAAADPAYWRRFLLRRSSFLLDVLRRAGRLPAGVRSRAMEASVRAALGRLRTIEAELCVRYVEAWQQDRRGWVEHLKRHSRLAWNVPDALTRLTRPGAPALTWRSSL